MNIRRNGKRNVFPEVAEFSIKQNHFLELLTLCFQLEEVSA